jgi:SAM-dependent methyltransferase
MDTSVPKFERFKWPKLLPPLSPDQQLISDDFMRHWHEVLPKKYGAIEHFNHTYPLRHLPHQPTWRTLEIGAGIGAHIAFEDLARQEYHCVELRENMASEIRRRFPGVHTRTGDCQERIPFNDGYFDRVVVIHVLEHLPRLPSALDEIRRVLRPGGVFSVVFPCDPGLAYELARKISAERIFRRRYKLSYRWLIRREHINSPAEITTLLRERFESIDESFFPLRIPISDLNLCIGMTLVRPEPRP